MHLRGNTEHRWTVVRHDFTRPVPTFESLPNADDLVALARRNKGIDGTPVFVGPGGQIDTRLLRYLRSREFHKLSETSRERYWSSQLTWLNFLVRVGRNWDAVTEHDIASYIDWRLLDPDNPNRISEGAYNADKAALVHLYKWASKDAGVKPPLRVEVINASSPSRADLVDDLLELDLDPGGENISNVRWLTPEAYSQWRDMGLRGYGVDLLPPNGLGLATEDRNHAFADGMYGSGCRRQEWASLLTLELPSVDPSRRYQRLMLGRKVAKGDASFRKVLVERHDLARTLTYIEEGSRQDAVRRAQRRGLYDDVPGRIEVLDHNPQTRKVRLASKGRWTSLDDLTVAQRRRMYVRDSSGWEPLWVWLSEGGRPLVLRSWNRIFNDANDRVQRSLSKANLSHSGLWCTPHMLRHSYAYRWFCFFETTYHLRLQHLTVEERKDYRNQFGDTWFLISTLLRHKDPVTTKKHYLAVFQESHVDAMLALMDQEQRAILTERLSETAQEDPRVLAALDLVKPVSGVAR